MKLPKRQSAYIPRQKLNGYLLSRTHPIGRWKSKLFRDLGFDENNVDLLEGRLIDIANSENVKYSLISELGTKYVIDGLLETPSGRFLRVRTVWIIDEGQDTPRFVTAYPV
jgi:hypothetical protein